MNKMGAMNVEEMEKYKGVFVFAQQVDNQLSGISFELIGEGKRLAEKLNEKVTAVLVGSDVAGLVGYDSPSKFTAAFHQTMGKTPLEYRKSII